MSELTDFFRRAVNKSYTFRVRLVKLSISLVMIPMFVLAVGVGQAYATAYRYYTVRLVTNFPATCSTVFNDAGFHEVHRCGGEDCFREVRTSSPQPPPGIDVVRRGFEHAIHGTGITAAEVNSGTCQQ